MFTLAYIDMLTPGALVGPTGLPAQAASVPTAW